VGHIFCCNLHTTLPTTRCTAFIHLDTVVSLHTTRISYRLAFIVSWELYFAKFLLIAFYEISSEHS